MLKYAFVGAFKTPLWIYVIHVHSIMQTSELQDGARMHSYRCQSQEGLHQNRVNDKGMFAASLKDDSCFVNEVIYFSPTGESDKAAAFHMILHLGGE